MAELLVNVQAVPVSPDPTIAAGQVIVGDVLSIVDDNWVWSDSELKSGAWRVLTVADTPVDDLSLLILTQGAPLSSAPPVAVPLLFRLYNLDLTTADADLQAYLQDDARQVLKYAVSVDWVKSAIVQKTLPESPGVAE